VNIQISNTLTATMTSNKMNLLLFALVSTLPIKDSFAFVQQKMKHKKWITHSFANKNSNNELEIDVDKAVYCASHFGECPVEEIEKLRDGKSKQQ